LSTTAASSFRVGVAAASEFAERLPRGSWWSSEDTPEIAEARTLVAAEVDVLGAVTVEILGLGVAGGVGAVTVAERSSSSI
jgi:hypothetical protein